MTESEQRKIFQEWLSSYKGLLFKIVRAYAFTPDDQDDLFQEISIQVWHSIPKFRYESAVSTWLYRISLNVAFKWTKKHRRHQENHQPLENMHHVLEEANEPVDERLAWLYEQIASFNEIDRSLTLMLLDGFSYKEMSNILGITLSNVGVKINRIKKSLITKSENYDYHGV
ncbi:MAG: RNA polymerase sigma factor [Bacteroidota bacterium]